MDCSGATATENVTTKPGLCSWVTFPLTVEEKVTRLTENDFVVTFPVTRRRV
jgi:hypothetical protein